MEGITSLVAESLTRHGFDRPVDYRRLQWSQWFPCESTHSLLLVPSNPGIFALAEEVAGPGETGTTGGKRMLAVLQFFEARDMAFVLDRMLSPANPMRARLLSGRCFARFVVIEDAAQRGTICGALNQWRMSSAGKASGTCGDYAFSLELAAQDSENRPAQRPAQQVDSGAGANLHCPLPLPSGF